MWGRDEQPAEAPDRSADARTDEVARILIICTANICRSPVVERLLASYADRFLGEVGDRIVVTSAGTHARKGDKAARPMIDIAGTWDLDIRDHRSRKVTADIAAGHDLIITMEAMHRDVVGGLGPGLGARTFILTELAALLAVVREDLAPDAESAGAGDRLRAAVAKAHMARTRTLVEAPDVDDPYGGPLPGYDECAWLLADLVKKVGDDLAIALAD